MTFAERCPLCLVARDRAGEIQHEPFCPHFMRGPDAGGDPSEWDRLPFTDAYFVCERCAHYHSSPERPHRCENCGAMPGWLAERPDLDAAEELSEAVLAERRTR